jgi:ubiquinone/menaquinone biosynthesis C-methylase UbiE
MTTPKDLIGHISGGKVLDVATGSGGFVGFLLEGLKDYAGITGIDVNERGAAAFAEAFKEQKNVRFEKMDAGQMTYPDASFDTVCIANSLHHMPDLPAALSEMKRVLRPGGTFIILEMYRDGQAETQLTHVHLHHWWGAVDRTQGVVHNETYTRGEIKEIIAGLGLQDMVTHDLNELEGDPKDPEAAKQLGDIIDRYIQRADGHPDLQQRGEELRQRVQEIGFHSAASLLVIGKK